MVYAITDFSRTKIKYITDEDVELSIVQRTENATGVGNTAATAGKPGRPSRAKLRAVHLESQSGPGGSTVRRRIVIGERTNNVYDSPSGAGALSMDGLADWAITGRTGEHMTY